MEKILVEGVKTAWAQKRKREKEREITILLLNRPF